MPITLSTANDLVNGDMVVRQQIGEFNEVAEPNLLDSTPDVLSIGRRCVEDGYAFYWEPYSLHPTIVTAEGKVVTLISRDCCPYLDDYEPKYVNPAVAAVTQEVGNSVTWDPEFSEPNDAISAKAGSVTSKGYGAVSAKAGRSDSYEDADAVSAKAGRFHSEEDSVAVSAKAGLFTSYDQEADASSAKAGSTVVKVKRGSAHPGFMYPTSLSATEDDDEDWSCWTAVQPALSARGFILPKKGAYAQAVRHQRKLCPRHGVSPERLGTRMATATLGPRLWRSLLVARRSTPTYDLGTASPTRGSTSRATVAQ